jgi:probable rRNA maturation factor
MIVHTTSTCYYFPVMKTPDHLVNVMIKRSLLFPYKRQWLRSIITTALSEKNIAGPMEINCVITDDENIRKFNRRYRGVDEPTDVLSFALTEKPRGEDAIEFPCIPDTPYKFGDILISYPRAVAQARELGHGVEKELVVLLVHGTLHLLDYDHQTAIEAKKMVKREKAISKILNKVTDDK